MHYGRRALEAASDLAGAVPRGTGWPIETLVTAKGG